MSDYHDEILQSIEALIFTAPNELTPKSIKKSLDHTYDQSFEIGFIEKQIETLQKRYENSNTAIQLINIAGGYQFMTKPKYYKIIADHLKLNEKKQLSRAALETLSIIAYKQPITKAVLESIRGVGCDYAIQKLLEKELVEITGRDEGPGRPLLYGTTVKFLDHFGIKNMSDLPNLKEFENVDNSVGNPTD